MKPSNYLIINIKSERQLRNLLDKYSIERISDYINGFDEYSKTENGMALVVKDNLLDGYAPLTWFNTQTEYNKLPQITAYEELKLTIKTTAQYR